jgi:surfeit locus 1 family protein
MTPRPRILPAALATLAALAILITLGVWQLHRRDWKLAMLAAIDHAEANPPVPLGKSPAPFSKVTVTGTLQPQTALYGVDVREQLGGPPREGAQRIAVLVRDDGSKLLVDLGWVATDQGAHDPRATPAQGTVTVQGYIRAPEHPTWLSAPDDPSVRRFYTLDPARIGASLGTPDVAPFTLVALNRIAGDAVPADALPRPPNNHLQYAFTWFGLAATLVGVFVAWLRKNRAARSTIDDGAF